MSVATTGLTETGQASASESSAGDEPEAGDDSGTVIAVILVLLLCLICGCGAYYSPKLRQAISELGSYSEQIDPAEARAAHAEMQEFEQRRWDMRELGLDSQIRRASSSTWSGSWSWTHGPGDRDSRQKQYKLEFQPAGQLEGHGLGAGGAGAGSRGWKFVLVGGTYNHETGRLLWREVNETFDTQGGMVLECDGQLRELSQGHEIEGQFSAFDTLGSRRVGRGHFKVSTEDRQIWAAGGAKEDGQIWAPVGERSPRSAADARGEDPPAVPLGKPRMKQGQDDAAFESDAV